jgi:hypothetical protein
MARSRYLPMSFLCAAGLLAGACGDDDDDSAATGTDATTTTAGSATETRGVDGSGDCLPVPQTIMDAIASGEERWVAMTPVAAAAWKSPDYEDATFIAMQFSRPEIEDQVGVWAMNNFDTGNGLMLAVDPVAQLLTFWPDADGTDARIAPTDPGVEEAKSCLE